MSGQNVDDTSKRVRNIILELDSRIRSAEAWIIDGAPTRQQCRNLVQRYTEAIDRKLSLLGELRSRDQTR